MRRSLIILSVFLFSCTRVEMIRMPSTASRNAKNIDLIADTTVNGVWDGSGKIITIHNYKIHGSGTFQKWDVDASVNQQIFDTSLTLKNIKCSNGPFSTAWLGASPLNPDNWWNIQKSINVCRDNHLECHTPGGGVYKYSKTLESSVISNSSYKQCSIWFTGDASYWDNGQGTTFQYTGTTGPGFNFQLNKGSRLEYVVFKGLWKSPSGPDSVYYNLSEAEYTDRSGNKLTDNYTGVAIDYNTPLDGSPSGSTGIEMSNVSIGGFAKALSFSANGVTQNDDANSINYIHFFDNKYCIYTGQPQEKGTSIDHIYSWGSVYNVLHHTGGGNYSFNVANIAGRTIEPIYASIGHWFSSTISNWFCENVGRVCTISAQMPFKIEGSNFDLNTNYSKQRIVINSNSSYTTFDNCTIRYYDGTSSDVWMHGSATFTGCYFGFGNLVYK